MRQMLRCDNASRWRAWRRAAAYSGDDDAIYARVTDDDAEGFWRRVGFESVPTRANATDCRGKGGIWLRRGLRRDAGDGAAVL